MPFGVMSPTQWAGLMMQRYLHESGSTEADFATFAFPHRNTDLPASFATREDGEHLWIETGPLIDAASKLPK